MVLARIAWRRLPDATTHEVMHKMLDQVPMTHIGEQHVPDTKSMHGFTDLRLGAQSVPGVAAKPKSQVPVWREGIAWSVLTTDYQRILEALADRARLGRGPLTCQVMAAAFGMDVVPARVEALRSKAKRMVARGWLAEPAPGRFTLAQGVGGPGGGP
jgi:hypothetical protein